MTRDALTAGGVNRVDDPCRYLSNFTDIHLFEPIYASRHALGWGLFSDRQKCLAVGLVITHFTISVHI